MVRPVQLNLLYLLSFLHTTSIIITEQANQIRVPYKDLFWWRNIIANFVFLCFVAKINVLLRHLKPHDGFHKQKIMQRNRKEVLTILLLVYHMPENFHITVTFRESVAMPHLLCCSCGSFANYSLQNTV